MSDSLAFDIRLHYPGFTLQAADEVPLHGITALSGPSGSGKTTLLRVIAGLERHAEGHVRFAGEDWTGLAPAARGIGYVFQDARLFPHLSVRQNLDYGARRRGTPKALVDAVTEALDLGPLLPRAPETLSGGETRRVALGRALASGPRILLLDEPLTGLDRARKTDLMPYIARAVAGFGVPAIYVTHAAGEIAFLADRTLTIADGALQGWEPAAPRLTGTVTGTGSGTVEVSIAGARLWLRGIGRVGETWAIPLGDDFLLSTVMPGVSNAVLTLPGRMQRYDRATRTCWLSIDDQILALPWFNADGAVPEQGTTVWLTLPQATGRVAEPSWRQIDSD